MIDVDTTLDSLRRVVKGREDYVFNDLCVYFDDGTRTEPRCIVGHVVVDLGLNWDDFVELNPSINDLDLSDDGRVVFESFFTPEAVACLSAAQTKQDKRLPWGVALQAALDTADVL